MEQEKINRGRHTDHLAGHHSIRTNQCLPPPSPIEAKKNKKQKLVSVEDISESKAMKK